MDIDIPIIEYINGIHGIDTRHPFLDRKLFQTWLNTTPNEKNLNYKHWIGQYLKSANYPFDYNQKIGADNPVVYVKENK